MIIVTMSCKPCIINYYNNIYVTLESVSHSKIFSTNSTIITYSQVQTKLIQLFFDKASLQFLCYPQETSTFTVVRE